MIGNEQLKSIKIEGPWFATWDVAEKFLTSIDVTEKIKQLDEWILHELKVKVTYNFRWKCNFHFRFVYY